MPFFAFLGHRFAFTIKFTLLVKCDTLRRYDTKLREAYYYALDETNVQTNTNIQRTEYSSTPSASINATSPMQLKNITVYSIPGTIYIVQASKVPSKSVFILREIEVVLCNVQKYFASAKREFRGEPKVYACKIFHGNSI